MSSGVSYRRRTSFVVFPPSCASQSFAVSVSVSVSAWSRWSDFDLSIPFFSLIGILISSSTPAKSKSRMHHHSVQRRLRGRPPPTTPRQLCLTSKAAGLDLLATAAAVAIGMEPSSSRRLYPSLYRIFFATQRTFFAYKTVPRYPGTPAVLLCTRVRCLWIGLF